MAGGMAYAGRVSDQVDAGISFSKLTSQRAKGEFRSQFIIYGRLNFGSSCEVQTKGAAKANLSKNLAGITVLQETFALLN